MSPAPGKAAHSKTDHAAATSIKIPRSTAAGNETVALLNHGEIAQLAFAYWEARGRPLGSPEEDWFRAERDLLMERLVWGQRTTPKVIPAA